MDFIHDRLALGRRYRIFDAVDIFTREIVVLEGRLSQTALLDLNRACRRNGRPQVIICDNGPEFSGAIIGAWARR